MRDFLAIFSIFKFNINVAHTECLSPLFQTPVFKYVVSLCMPLVLALALGVVVLSAHVHTRLVKRHSAWLRRRFPASFAAAARIQLRVIIRELHLPLPVADPNRGRGSGAHTLGEYAEELVELFAIITTTTFVEEKYEAKVDQQVEHGADTP